MVLDEFSVVLNGFQWFTIVASVFQLFLGVLAGSQ